MPCLTPRTVLKNGLEVTVGCQKCSECQKGRVRDLTGRCLAESMYSVGATFWTGTYGKSLRLNGADDADGAARIMYSHFQRFVKRLRRAGFLCRYIVAGENGPKKGRSHFHAILFWTRRVPEVPYHATGENGQRRCWNDPWWTPYHGGHTQWAKVEASTCRYIAKYATKDSNSGERRSVVRRSTRPMLGYAYFDEWARRHVLQQLAPRDRYFTVPGSVDKQTGKLWKYWMTDAAARYVVKSFVRQWAEVYPGRHPPPSEFVERELDKLGRPVPDAEAEGQRPRRRRYLAKPHEPTPNGEAVLYDERLHCWYFVLGHTKKWAPFPERAVRFYWTFDQNGERWWGPVFVSLAEGEKRWRAYVQSQAADAYAEASGAMAKRKITRK